ncbi:MAG TPA: hypothetical protein VK524_10895 [Polyangiaceae bacterium]|nr:hypothetical protein [Polyangiaceae bacterium]
MAQRSSRFHATERLRLSCGIGLALAAHVALGFLALQSELPQLTRPAAPLHWVELAERDPEATAQPAAARAALQSSRTEAAPRTQPRVRRVSVNRTSPMQQPLATPAPERIAAPLGGGGSKALAAAYGSGSDALAKVAAAGTPSARAVLIADSAACTGIFPTAANSERGVVTVALRVAATGRASGARLLDERPLGEGFGGAARQCLERVRFQPALDRLGRPVASESVLRLRFARHTPAKRALSAALSR